MLIHNVERYLSLRRTLGFTLRNTAQRLRAYAQFAADRGDTHVNATTAVEWAEAAPSPNARHVRLRDVVNLARFLHAEDTAHEVPVLAIFPAQSVRPIPYIYTEEEVVRMLTAAEKLRETHPLRRPGYATLLGLIASTGLRVSEALDLRFDDVLADGVLHIRRSKFGKSRLIPLHATTRAAFDRYLEVRQAHIVPDDHVFLSISNRRISSSTVHYTFRRILKLAQIAPDRTRTPRIHDLRHTMATRALERCPMDRRAVSQHFVALSTYLGHVDIKQTYWYLQATPELMTDIAAAAEVFADGGEQ
jgi:integrase